MALSLNITCAYCGRKESGEAEQPKQLAKKLGWKHGNVKGVWVCPECLEFIPASPRQSRRYY
jgi:hypothetical protein